MHNEQNHMNNILAVSSSATHVMPCPLNETRKSAKDKMQLPRRVPWATVAELDQLCSWIYAEDAHDSSRNLSIERVRITRSRVKLNGQKFALHE